MIDTTFTFSVDPGAAPTQVLSSAYTPCPFDGFIEIYAVTDPIAGLTALPTLSFTLGATPTPQTPLQQSVIPVNQFGIIFAGPTLAERRLSRTAVRTAQNLQLLLGGGAGATATGRIRVVLYTPEEAAASPG